MKARIKLFSQNFKLVRWMLEKKVIIINQKLRKSSEWFAKQTWKKSKKIIRVEIKSEEETNVWIINILKI